MGDRPGAGHPKTGADQAGRRPEHGCLQPDGGLSRSAKDGFLDEHVKFIRPGLQGTPGCDAGDDGRDCSQPKSRWTHPLGGMFLWGILPE